MYPNITNANRSNRDVRIDWRPCNSDLVPKYLAFAAATFGREQYQACPQYLDWLYRSNPNGLGLSKLLLAILPDGEVIGCSHRMHLPWQNGERQESVPALHNLMVDPQYRTGVGAMLILKSLEESSHTLLSGAGGALARTYAKIGCERIDMRWYRKVLRPLAGAGRLLGRRIAMVLTNPTTNTRIRQMFRLRPISVRAIEELQACFRGKGEFCVYADPPLNVLVRVAGALNAHHAECWGPHWTPELLVWRCFHPLGPQHLLVERSRNETSAQAIVSVGPRYGLAAGRLICHTAENSEVLLDLMRFVEDLLRRSGVDVLFAASADPVLQATANAAGLTRLKDEPGAFLYHRNRLMSFGRTRLQGIATDLGFEGLTWRGTDSDRSTP